MARQDQATVLQARDHELMRHGSTGRTDTYVLREIIVRPPSIIDDEPKASRGSSCMRLASSGEVWAGNSPVLSRHDAGRVAGSSSEASLGSSRAVVALDAMQWYCEVRGEKNE